MDKKFDETNSLLNKTLDEEKQNNETLNKNR